MATARALDTYPPWSLLTDARLRNGVITNVELQSAETGVEEAELGRLTFQYQLLLGCSVLH